MALSWLAELYLAGAKHNATLYLCLNLEWIKYGYTLQWCVFIMVLRTLPESLWGLFPVMCGGGWQWM